MSLIKRGTKIPLDEFRGKFIDVAEVYQRRWLEESGQ